MASTESFPAKPLGGDHGHGVRQRARKHHQRRGLHRPETGFQDDGDAGKNQDPA